MNSRPDYTNNWWNSFTWLLAAVATALTMAARAETPPAAIPFPDIGAKATADYQGDALGVTATADDAHLRCGFQKLRGHATPEGLWLESTKPGAAGKLRVTATALRRDSSRARECALTEPDVLALFAPTDVGGYTALATSGYVSVSDKLVRFTRPGLIEEYSVSVDGVRQDFIIESPPLNPQRLTLNQPAGDLRVELALSGARAEATASGARLRLQGSGRVLAYSRLRVEDATGRELKARLEVLSSDRLDVSVADANATYPVRIDPTFSDADWVSLNPGLPGANPGLPGVNNHVFAIVADGSGNVYVGGDFTFIGTVMANRIAKWDGSAWSALGSGMDSDVLALAMGGTNLYAGGGFTRAGGVTANGIAKWDGHAWSALGWGFVGVLPPPVPPNIPGRVFALAVIGTNLYAGGLNIIAKWDGSAWSGLGSWITGGIIEVKTLAVMGTNLYAGGAFTNALGVSATNIAKWDGRAWSALGSGVGGVPYPWINSYVSALAVSGTNLYAGGLFTTAGGAAATNIAKWDGSAWSALDSGISGEVDALAVSGTNLYAGGGFTTAGGVAATNIAKWDGGVWSAFGSGMSGGSSPGVSALAMSGTNLYAGGGFTTAGGVAANCIAKWDGGAWSALGSGMNGDVIALAVVGTNLYAGGLFTTAGGVPANHIAKWDGRVWSALGSGINGEVDALAVSGTNLYAGGDFTTAGGVPADCIAKWDGSTWSALGSGMRNDNPFFAHAVYALAVSGTNLYAGGAFTNAGGVPANYIAKWNGSAWSALGSGMDSTGPYPSPYVYALAVIGTNLYAGGHFTAAGHVNALGIAKWNGSAWSALGKGIYGIDLSGHFSGRVSALAVIGSNLYAGGHFELAGDVTANGIAEWDGNAWSALGQGMNKMRPGDEAVSSLALIGTHLCGGGTFTNAGGVAANCIAEWDGTTWSALGSGMNGYVNALAADGAGHLFVGGDFSLAGTNVSFYIAQANVGSSPTILRPPQSQTAEDGAVISFAAEVTGYPPPTYQWLFNGNAIAGCTNSVLCLSDVQATNVGAYSVMVGNGFGAVTSSLAMLDVIAPVERRPVPGVGLTGASGSWLNVDYANALNPMPAWNPLGSVSLTSSPQYCFDTSQPLPPQRFYRAWQTGTPSIAPSLNLNFVPAITLTGSIGGRLRVDGINQFGPIDAWFTLDTVTLTNTSQLYFDVSAPGQPERLYRLVQVP